MTTKILMHDWISDYTPDEIAETLAYKDGWKEGDAPETSIWWSLWQNVDDDGNNPDFWDTLIDDHKLAINAACVIAHDEFEKESAARKIEFEKQSAKNKIEHDHYLLRRFDNAMDDRIDAAIDTATENDNRFSILIAAETSIFVDAYDYYFPTCKNVDQMSAAMFNQFSTLYHCPTLEDVKILAVIVDFKIDYDTHKFWDNGAGCWLLISVNS